MPCFELFPQPAYSPLPSRCPHCGACQHCGSTPQPPYYVQPTYYWPPSWPSEWAVRISTGTCDTVTLTTGEAS